MTDDGHAAVEFALAVGVLLLPVVLVVASFGPWSERRVLAESAAAEAARVAVIELDVGSGVETVRQAITSHGLSEDLVRLGWCGSPPELLSASAGSCSLTRGSTASVVVEVWVPLVHT
ncbi:MAG: TadE/TadG family type IV pilus assembly protein, partial [Acidimicrobiia bacterium]